VLTDVLADFGVRHTLVLPFQMLIAQQTIPAAFTPCHDRSLGHDQHQ
jgi:hypothetical protein